MMVCTVIILILRDRKLFSLHAAQSGDDLEDRIQLCATNGVTYNSLCQLLQDTGNVQVAYVGACDSAECNGGNVRKLSIISSVTSSQHMYFIYAGMWYRWSHL